MKKFIATKGLSFSGKTTWAKEKAEELGNTVVITKDDIRLALGKNVKESKVIERRNELIIKALEKGQNIISADTNLSRRIDHIKNMKALVFPKYQNEYTFEVKDFTDTPIDVILERVEKTNRPEGKAFWKGVVMKQKNEFIKPPIIEQDNTLPKCVISDHDGTIAHMCNRSPYTGIGSENDAQNEIVCEYLRLMFMSGYTIFILSGLEDTYKVNRENWLKANDVPYHHLYMRKAGDHRKDWIIKNEIFEEHIQGRYFIHSILDDRPQMLKYWIEKGYSQRLLSIGNPYYEF